VPAKLGGTPSLASDAPPKAPFEQEVASLESRRIDPSQRPIIFYGSSSIRRWKTLSDDFVGYPVVNCGFGGSRLIDCLRYVSPVVLRLKPAAVVVYAGDNDLAQGAQPEQAFTSFRDLFDALRGYSEQMPIAYISVNRARLGSGISTTSLFQSDGGGVPATPTGDQIHRYLYGYAWFRP
jgi:hypothetical protein